MSPGVAFFLKNEYYFNGSALSVKTGLCFLTLKQLGNALAPHGRIEKKARYLLRLRIDHISIL